MKSFLKMIVLSVVFAYTTGCNNANNDTSAPTPVNRTFSTTSTTKVSTLAGSGTAGKCNGAGTSAQFNCPSGLAVDSQGNIYVADRTNHCIRKITCDGFVSTLAGCGKKGAKDGNCDTAQFNCPTGVAVDAQGNVYVADQGNHCIRKISCHGVVSTLAGNCTQGWLDGPCSSAQFNCPSGVAVDKYCNVYVADQMNHRIRKINCYGDVSTVAGCTQGFTNGYCTSAQFHNTTALSVDINDNLYVVDQCNFTIRKITPGGDVSTYSCSSNNNGNNNQFGAPCGIAVDAKCNIYIADQTNKHIQKITPSGTICNYTCPGIQNNVDGTNFSCQVSVPCGLTADAGGNVYLSVYSGQCIHKISDK
jgi:secreted PhoX family phosphatase